MTDRPRTPTNTPTSTQRAGRYDRFKGLDRATLPTAAELDISDAIPAVYTGLPEALKAIDGVDHGRKRVYDRADEPPTDDHQDDADAEHLDQLQEQAEADQEIADQVAAAAAADEVDVIDDADGMEL